MVVQQRDLAEKIAGAVDGQNNIPPLFIQGVDFHRPGQDHMDRPVALVLAQNRLAPGPMFHLDPVKGPEQLLFGERGQKSGIAGGAKEFPLVMGQGRLRLRLVAERRQAAGAQAAKIAGNRKPGGGRPLLDQGQLLAAQPQ